MTAHAVPPPADRRGRAHRLGCLLLPAMLAPAQLFLVGPLAVYHGNRGEMGVPLLPLLPYLLVPTLAAWLLLLALGLALPRRLVAPYRVLVTAVGVVMWLLGSVWVGDYGVFDGRAIDFSLLAWRTPWELLVWLAVPLAALLAHRRLAAVGGVLAGALLTVQLTGLAFAGSGGDEAAGKGLLPPAELFQLSEQSNALILVLDAFQSEAFLEQVEDDAAAGGDLAARFDGFTFFPDHTSAFPNTRPSIPALLSGRRYANDQLLDTFYADTLDNHSLITALDAAGWEVDMVSMVGRLIRGPLTVAYRLPRPFAGPAAVRFHEAARLLDVSLFRHAPHRLKPAVYNDQEWRAMSLSKLSRNVHQASNGKDFLDRFTASLAIGRQPPVAKIIHVGIPHLPAVLDAECRWIGVQKESRQRYVDQTRCAVRLVEALLARLRALDVYDPMLIVIAADHGTVFPPPSFEGFAPQPAAMPWLVGRAMPLLLIKPPGSHGRLAVSPAPTTITDVPATVAPMLGLDTSFPGTPVFGLDAAAVRERPYDAYFWEDVGDRDGYFHFVHRFAIRGPVRDAGSWHYLGTAYPPDQRLPAARVEIGTTSALPYLGLGWSRARSVDGEDLRWALGARASLQVSLPETRLRVRARLRIPAFVQPQRIALWVDGARIGVFEGPSDSFFEPEADLDAGPRPAISNIEFRFDRFTTHGDDPRPLAAQVSWIAFDDDE